MNHRVSVVSFNAVTGRSIAHDVSSKPLPAAAVNICPDSIPAWAAKQAVCPGKVSRLVPILAHFCLDGFQHRPPSGAVFVRKVLPASPPIIGGPASERTNIDRSV